MCMHACVLSRDRLFVTPWTVAHQSPLFMGFSSKNTGVGCHFFLQGMNVLCRTLILLDVTRLP